VYSNIAKKLIDVYTSQNLFFMPSAVQPTDFHGKFTTVIGL